MAGIRNPALFKLTYEATRRLTERAGVPTRLVWPGETVLRSVQMKFVPSLIDGRLPRSEAEGVITIRDADQDRNRWTGTGPAPALPMGGLYVSLTSGSLSAELTHYNRSWLPKEAGTGFADVMDGFARAGTPVRLALFRLRTRASMLMADLAPPAGGIFYNDLARDPALKTELAKLPGSPALSALANAPDDYTIPRAIGLALAASRGYAGLIAPTAREDRAARDAGDNAVFFGANGPCPVIVVDQAMLFHYDDGGALKLNRIPLSD